MTRGVRQTGQPDLPEATPAYAMIERRLRALLEQRRAWRSCRTAAMVGMSVAMALVAVRVKAVPPTQGGKSGAGGALSQHEQIKARAAGKLNAVRAIAGPSAAEKSKLQWQQSGVAEKFGPLQFAAIEMNEEAPAGLKSRPRGLTAPRYGLFEVGPAGRTVPVYVIIDGPKGQPATLYVNRKADGEMIDEPGYPLILKSGWTLYGAQVTLEIPCAGGRRMANLQFARFDPLRKPDAYEWNLFIAADCGYAGTAVIDGKSVPTTVLDAGFTGAVKVKGDLKSTGRFWFDFNHDGKCDSAELVHGGLPFQFNGKWWAITSMGIDGTIGVAPTEMPLSLDEIAANKPATVAQAKALEDYLAANPHAPDFRYGLLRLFMYYRNVAGDSKKALATLDREYQNLVARGNRKSLKDALRLQFEFCVGMGAEDGALVALEREHAVLVKETPRDFKALGTNLNDWVSRLTRSNQPAGLAKARELVSRAKKEFAGNPDVEGTSHLFAVCEGMCGRPVVGGALQIAFTALDGTAVDLAAMRGKVVLVDFWATWCPPCVASQPGIKAAYDKFHARGFEVIGISLDDADRKNSVVQFLKDKKLPWPQLFDGNGWDTPPAVACGIKEIPTSYLLGKDGKIAAIDLGGDALVKTLEELLKGS